MAESNGNCDVGRFAPYPVWMTMRILTMIGTGLFLLWFGSAIAALFSAVNGGDLDILPMWIGVVGLIIGGSDGGFRRDENVSLFGEMIGRMLASKDCPDCGQSLFDHTPSSGYAPETQTRRWWPLRLCAQCGHDLKQRLPGQPPQASR